LNLNYKKLLEKKTENLIQDLIHLLEIVLPREMGFKVKIFFLILFILIAGALIVGIYKVSKDSTPAVLETKKLLLGIKDRETAKLIIANYSIYNGTMLIKSGVTRDDSIIEIDIPIIYSNINVRGTANGYYNAFYPLLLNKYIIYLDRIGNFNISHLGNLNATNGKIILNISTDNILTPISICVRWSGNMLDVTHSFYPKVRELRTQLDCEFSGYLWIPQKMEEHWFKPDNITEGY